MEIEGHEAAFIDGPLGPFLIPASPPETRRICEGLSKLLWEGGEYEHPDLPKDGIQRVLDIGAGWGAFTVWARRRWPGIKQIDCYDPHALGCKFVAVNDPRARVHQVAVTSQPSARISIGQDWGASSTHFNRGDGVSVPVVHPRDLSPCDMLKVDAEGVEAEILAEYPTLSSTPIVTYEWHTPALREECRAICARRGGLRCIVDRDGPWGGGNGVAIWVSAR